MTSFIAPLPDVQPICWADIECALYDWLNDTLEMENRIIWENQSIPQPAYPYLSLLNNTEVDVGMDERRVRTVDADGKILGVDPSAGAAFENEVAAHQSVDWTFTVQAHVDPDCNSNDPGASAMAILSKAKRSLGLRSVKDQLSLAGISVLRKLAILDTSLVVNGRRIQRATMDVLLSTASVLTDRVEFVDKVQIENPTLGVSQLVDAS